MDGAYNLPLLHGDDVPVRQRADGVWLICHGLTKAWLVLQPEEWVRQHLIRYLWTLGYPASLMRAERKVAKAVRQSRFDVLCYDKQGVPLLLAECKASGILLDKAVLQQAGRYNKTMRAAYILITNGLSAAYYQAVATGYKQLSALPTYAQVLAIHPG